MFENLIDPVILCFVVGLVAGLLKSDLKLPDQLYETLSIYLLFTIGLKGGVELAVSNVAEAISPGMVTIALGILIPIIAYNILRKIGKFPRIDAASIAAHYGSVSAVTFAVVLSYLARYGVGVESFVTVLLVILEIPAIAVGIIIARTRASKDDESSTSKPFKLGPLLHEVFLGKSIYLLVAGLFVGYVSGPDRIQSVAPVFFDLFKGALAIFLLEMGIITSRRFGDLKRTGLFLVAFGIMMPLMSGSMGAFLGTLSGLSIGGTTVLATLAASASYIAAPAAMRIALPKANPTLSLTASLGITFPFNIVVGIPIYYAMAQFFAG
jgi:uncharacterized protein